MLAIAAIDGVFELIEYVIAQFMWMESVNLWPVMLGTGLVVLVVDLLIEYRGAVGRCCRDTASWIQSKLSGSAGS